MKIEQVVFPIQSTLSKNKYDYSDSFQFTVKDYNDTLNPVMATKALFRSSPNWIGRLMNLRNRIVSVFGLKTGGNISDKETLMRAFEGNEGESLGLFKVFKKTSHELILGEDDNHLDFRVSLLVEKAEHLSKHLTMTTTVTYNNWFGRLYFFFVKPFHKLIVPAMMRGMLKEIEKE